MQHADANKATILWGNWQTREGRPLASQQGLSLTGRIAGWSVRHRWWVVATSALFLYLAMFVFAGIETL
jgi:hypothetical protein